MSSPTKGRPTSTGILLLLLCQAAAVLAGEPTVESLPVRESAYLNATLWTQRAPEREACLLSLFRQAIRQLDVALDDSSQTAAPAEQVSSFAAKLPALIMDVDETVLDNSPFVARLVAQGRHYDAAAIQEWDRWVKSAQAMALPGAVEFIRQAQSRRVAVFFISNREAGQEEATRRNLEALGLFLDEHQDVVLLKGERPGWGSQKGTRRKVVAETHRILLLLGDSLEDFIDTTREAALNGGADLATEQLASHWGRDWIMLPNPLYGSWEEAGFDHDSTLPRDRMVERMTGKLQPWNGE